MAKIQIATRENLQTGQGISAPQPASPIAVIGTQLAKVGEEFERKAHQSFVSNEVTTRYANYIKADSDFTGERSSDVNGFATLKIDWDKNSVELRNNAFKDLTDPDAKRILTKQILNYSTRQSINVQSIARKQGVTSARGKTIASLVTLKEQAIIAKNSDVPDIMLTARNNLAMQVQAGIYTPEQVDSLLKKFNGEVQESRILQLIRTNPNGALDILKAKDIPGIDKGRHLQLRNIARSMAKQGRAVATQEIKQLKADDLLSIQKFGKGVPNLLNKIKRIEGNSAAVKYKKQQDLSMKLYNGNTTIKSLSGPEINQFIAAETAKVKPGAGASQQSALLAEYIKTARTRIKLITDNPVKAIKQSLLLKKDPKEVEEEKKDPIEINPLLKTLLDFGKGFPSSLGGQVAKGIENEKILSVQKAAKVDPQKIRLLENGEAKGIITIYQNAKPADKHKVFAQLRLDYTKENYKIVFRDLVREGLPVEAIVMNSFADNPKGTQLSIDLSRAIDLGPKLKKDVPGEDIKEIKAAITTATNQYFSTITSFSQSSLTIPYTKDVKAAIEKVALVKMQALQMDPEEAGKQAADEVINIRYNFYEDSQSFSALVGSKRAIRGREYLEKTQKMNIRVPKKYDVDTVIEFSALRFLRLTEEKNKFNVKPGLSIVIPGASVERRREAYVKILADHGTWVTNSDDDGLIMIDDNRQPVVNMEGVKFGFKFDEMNFGKELASRVKK